MSHDTVQHNSSSVLGKPLLTRNKYSAPGCLQGPPNQLFMLRAEGAAAAAAPCRTHKYLVNVSLCHVCTRDIFLKRLRPSVKNSFPVSHPLCDTVAVCFTFKTPSFSSASRDCVLTRQPKLSVAAVVFPLVGSRWWSRIKFNVLSLLERGTFWRRDYLVLWVFIFGEIDDT